jgi:hypothetical protein
MGGGAVCSDVWVRHYYIASLRSLSVWFYLHLNWNEFTVLCCPEWLQSLPNAEYYGNPQAIHFSTGCYIDY